MSPETYSIAECRSFIAALYTMSDVSEHTYIDQDEKKDQHVYTNWFGKPIYFKTKQIFDTIDHCSALLQTKEVKINEEERQVLLKNLKRGLEGYERRLCAFFKEHWFRDLFSWCTYRRISQLKTSIKEVAEEAVFAKEKPIGGVCQTLLLQIRSLFSTIVSVKDFEDVQHLKDFVYSKLTLIPSWREQSIELPFNECREVYKSLFGLVKTLGSVLQEQSFRIQQKIQTNSIPDCRSFIAALRNISEAPELQTYIDGFKKETHYGFINEDFCFKLGRFKTKQIFASIEYCSTLLQTKGLEINEEERQVLLKNLKRGLEGYERRLRAFFKIHWLRGLFAWYTYRRISQLKTSIKEVTEEAIPAKEKPLGGLCQTLLLQIQSQFPTIASVKDCQDRQQISGFLYSKNSDILDWREQAVKLPWNECWEVCKSIFTLKKELSKAANEQWFHVQQKKAIAETKQLLERVKNELNQAVEVFVQKLNSARGVGDVLKICNWLIHNPEGIVAPLRPNRFFKLSPEDSKSPEAVEVSREIADCFKSSQQLEEAFHVWLNCRIPGHTTDFREMMKKHEEELKQLAQEAQGDEVLQEAFGRLNNAIEKNSPELFFSLEKLPSDLHSFETVRRKTTLFVHPDKHQNHKKAADILFKIREEIVTWIKQKKYN